MSGRHRAPRAPGPLLTLREAPSAVKAVLLGVLVNRLGAFFQTFLVLFLTHRGFGGVEAGVALAAFGGGSLAGVLLGGALADRLGPRAATLISMLGSSGLLLSVLYVHTIGPLVVAVTLVGLVGQLYRPASATLLSELAPADRQVMTFALYRWVLNLGTTAAPLFAALLISVSYDLLFWTEAATSACFAVIAATALPRRAPSVAAHSSHGPRGGYVAILADRRFSLYLLAMLVNATVYIQYVCTLPLMIHDSHVSTVWFSVVVALNGFIVITCELPATKVVQRMQPRTVAVAGFALLGLGLSLYSLPLGVASLLTGTVVWSLAEIVGGPTMFAYPGMVAPPALRGRYIAAAQLMFSVGAVIGPVAGVWLYRAVGAQLWLWCGAASLVGLLLASAGMRASAASGPEPAVALEVVPVAA
jgi:predicted MFS family arabinose efflux permease